MNRRSCLPQPAQRLAGSTGDNKLLKAPPLPPTHAVQAGKRKQPAGEAPEGAAAASAAATGAAGAAAGAPGQPSWVDEDSHREELISACECALGLRLPRYTGSGSSGGSSSRAELWARGSSEQPGITINEAPAVAAATLQPVIDGSSSPAVAAEPSSSGYDCSMRLIIFNLFGLEGYHIAEALGVPCVAASPCQVC